MLLEQQQTLERARKSPFYAEHLRGITRFEDAPITLKQHLRAGYPFGFLVGFLDGFLDGVLPSPRGKGVSYHESSGTEGSPIASYFSVTDWDDITSRFLRNSIDLSAEDTFFIKTPYSMVTTAHQAHKAGESVGAIVIPAGNRTTNMPYQRVIQLLRDLKVTVTWSLPNELLLWAFAARANGLDPRTDFPNIRAFWVAGEALSAARKQALSKLWGGKPIFEDYGSTETGSLAGECQAGRLHTWGDRIKFEIIDNNKISNYGRGQLLVTPINRTAMPLIRYLIEDDVELTPSDCSCGSPFDVIEILGRRTSRLTVSDQSLFPKKLEQAVFSAGLAYGISFWRANYGAADFEVEFYSEEQPIECARAIESGCLTTLGIKTIATVRPIDAFVDPSLFVSQLEYSKPNYITRRTI